MKNSLLFFWGFDSILVRERWAKKMDPISMFPVGYFGTFNLNFEFFRFDSKLVRDHNEPKKWTPLYVPILALLTFILNFLTTKIGTPYNYKNISFAPINTSFTST